MQTLPANGLTLNGFVFIENDKFHFQTDKDSVIFALNDNTVFIIPSQTDSYTPIDTRSVISLIKSSLKRIFECTILTGELDDDKKIIQRAVVIIYYY